MLIISDSCLSWVYDIRILQTPFKTNDRWTLLFISVNLLFLCFAILIIEPVFTTTNISFIFFFFSAGQLMCPWNVCVWFELKNTWTAISDRFWSQIVWIWQKTLFEKPSQIFDLFVEREISNFTLHSFDDYGLFGKTFKITKLNDILSSRWQMTKTIHILRQFDFVHWSAASINVYVYSANTNSNGFCFEPTKWVFSLHKRTF